MEDALGVFFSVLAVSVALAGIAAVSHTAKQDEIEMTNMRALSELTDQCEYVCQAGEGTALPIEVTMHPGIVLYAHDNKICMRGEDDVSCEVCPCPVSPYTMNLSKSFLHDSVGRHTYTCDFTRQEEGIAFECQG